MIPWINHMGLAHKTKIDTFWCNLRTNHHLHMNTIYIIIGALGGNGFLVMRWNGNITCKETVIGRRKGMLCISMLFLASWAKGALSSTICFHDLFLFPEEAMCAAIEGISICFQSKTDRNGTAIDKASIHEDASLCPLNATNQEIEFRAIVR